MKVRIDIDEQLQEEEIIIRCKRLDDKTQELYQMLMGSVSEPKHLVLFKEHTQYYLPIDQILFFETSESSVSAHTADNMFQTEYRLYELEKMLPFCFMRVSKSTIVNLNHIYSITRNLTASSVVQFLNTHKQVYVSRYYYKPLKSRLDEKRKGL